MTQEPAKPPVAQIRTPEGWTKGVYANGAGVWSSANEFTIDFFVSLPPESGTGPDGETMMVVPQEVVARVKIPPPLVFQLMRNLSTAMDVYEKQHGKIPEFGGGRAPGQSDPPDAR